MKNKVIINAHKNQFEDLTNFKIIRDKLNPTEWMDDLETFSLEITYQTTYKLLDNQFSHERAYENREDGYIPYTLYLDKEDIRTLNYFDYAGEKIHRLFEFNLDYYVARPSDLELVTNGLLEYLVKNPSINRDPNIINELKDLNLLSRIFSNTEINFLIFNPNI